MRRREVLKASAALAAALLPAASEAAPARPPNIVLILCDDLGYGDVGAFGGKMIRTPNIDRLAAEGVALTDYYAPANLCTPSRAGLLTGRYPIRTGLGYEVIMQNDDRGLPLSEVTIARALKPDYATALFGKWHLGHRGEAWPPTRHGFDRFFGIPYSHDMAPLSLFEAQVGSDEVKSSPVDYPTLQQQFYEHAERFIEDNRERPFFVELALSAPHLPEHPHAPFKGTTPAGTYGDVVAEIDSLVGRLMARLKDLGLERNTLVVFTSDNGPWFEGSAGGFRERKGGGGFDGGYRVPFIARMPGTIPGGRRVDSIASGIDLLPTFCAMAGRPIPPGVELDGKDITQVLVAGAPSPHDQIVLFDNENVVGVRTQRWKYIGAAYYRGLMMPMALMGYQELYDARADPAESYSVAETYPDAAAEMKARLDKAKAEFAPLKHKDIPPVFKALHQALEHMED
ncbi:sulfatase family protein [Phenylobacterium montanum]|uniref:Sulfatase n=1 Tax=Phenylobacterium montanum TaxID=2823693 RepID=A0A975FVD6_9CAUL|nr:sulfatase [Caulobacter sp. S6]QUD85984.1 sulfatase [Caulobacter sp. S6]